jgi:hypothetical protein
MSDPPRSIATCCLSGAEPESVAPRRDAGDCPLKEGAEECSIRDDDSVCLLIESLLGAGLITRIPRSLLDPTKRQLGSELRLAIAGKRILS